MSPHSVFKHKIKKGNRAFAYILDGKGVFDVEKEDQIENEQIIIFTDGEDVEVRTTNSHLRFLLISGKPLKEPIAWYGPIVMNTQEEVENAFEEYRNGTFIKKR